MRWRIFRGVWDLVVRNWGFLNGVCGYQLGGGCRGKKWILMYKYPHLGAKMG